MHKPLLCTALLLALAACQRTDPKPTPVVKPIDQLPPATQTGAGTFGCLLNGQAWTPAGNPFAGPILSTQYFNGNLSIGCIRAFNGNQGVPQVDQVISFKLDTISVAGTYTVDGQRGRTLRFANYLTNCTTFATSASPATLQLTRLDPVARIVSGTFAFTLETPGCEKVVVTAGRFDSRF